MLKAYQKPAQEPINPGTTVSFFVHFNGFFSQVQCILGERCDWKTWQVYGRGNVSAEERGERDTQGAQGCQGLPGTTRH